MNNSTPAQVRAAFLAMVYRQTKSLSLTRDCKKAFDAKEVKLPMDMT